MEQDPDRCAAFTAAMSVLGRPWNGLLLRALGEGPRRFSELAESVSIGDRMLSTRMKELEAAGLVARRVDPGPPVRVSYALTELGQGLRRVNLSVEEWGRALLAAQGPGPLVCPESEHAPLGEADGPPPERGRRDG